MNDSQVHSGAHVMVCSDKHNSGYGTAPLSQAQAWGQVNISHNKANDFNEKPFWQKLWCGLQAGVPRAFVNPIGLYQCTDLSRCLGVQTGLGSPPSSDPAILRGATKDQDCVCYQ